MTGCTAVTPTEAQTLAVARLCCVRLSPACLAYTFHSETAGGDAVDAVNVAAIAAEVAHRQKLSSIDSSWPIQVMTTATAYKLVTDSFALQGLPHNFVGAFHSKGTIWVL